MYFLEVLEILFLVKCCKLPEPSFPVLNFVFFFNVNTRSLSFQNSNITLTLQNFLNILLSKLSFLECPPSPLPFCSSFTALKPRLKKFFWSNFLTHYNVLFQCTYHIFCPCVKCSQLSMICNYTTNCLMSM